jgi:hypothetical protein
MSQAQYAPMTGTANPSSISLIDRLRTRLWFSVLLNDYLNDTARSIPKSIEEWSELGHWIAQKFKLKSKTKAVNGLPADRVIGPKTLRAWYRGDQVPTNDVQVFAHHYGAHMNVFDSSNVCGGFGLFLHALDVLDVSDAEDLVDRLPESVNLVQDEAARARFIEQIDSLRAPRIAAARALLGDIGKHTILRRRIDVTSVAEPWFMAAHQYVPAETGWVPEPTWGSNVLSAAFSRDTGDRLDQGSPLVRLGEAGCRIVSKDLPIPPELEFEFASAFVCEVGIRLNSDGHSELGFGLDAAERFVDLTADALLFLQSADQFDIEARVGCYGDVSNEDEWVPWLAQFLLRVRERLAQEFESFGQTREDILPLISRAMQVGRFSSSPELWIPSTKSLQGDPLGELPNEPDCL